MIVLRFLEALLMFLWPAVLAGLISRKLSRRSREEWQLLAWVPIAPLLIWGVYIAWDVTADPTSHNLWPFELVGWMALSALLFAFFLVMRRLAGGKS